MVSRLCGDTGLSAIQQLEQFEFHHTLAETIGPALVFFSGPHCGSCRALKLALKTLISEEESLKVFEVDAQQDMALAREFEVFHLPALFLFKDGQYHGPVQSEPLPRRLRAAIRETLSRAPEEAP